MKEIALHILDIAENSVTAGARHIEIVIEEDLPGDRLRIIIGDDGQGMNEELINRISNPFVTSRTTRRVGLGVPLFKAAAEACNGCLQITSALRQGTCLKAEFQRSHIDRMPLGDLAGTLLTLVVGYPQIHWRLHYRVKRLADTTEAEFIFDDEPIKQELGDISLTEPVVLTFLRELLQDGIRKMQDAAVERVANQEVNICQQLNH